MKITVMLCALIVLAIGCKNEEKAKLSGHEWQLSQLSVDQKDLQLPAEAPTLLFTDSAAIYGSAGCNRFFGKYTADNNKMTVEPGGMTMMMCPDMEFEDQFIKSLKEVAAYNLTSTELKLTDANGKIVMVFIPKDTTNMVGMASDSHGCNAAAGYTWSEVQQNCIRLFEQGVRLNSVTDTAATLSAFIVFSADSTKVEVFIPNQEVHPVLDRRALPDGGYAWNIEDDDTLNVRLVDGKWLVEQRMQTLYQQ